MPKLETLQEPMYDLFLREVKKELAEKNITQIAAAKQIRTSQYTLNQGLNKRIAIRACYVFRLAKWLNISLDKITGVRVKKKENPQSRTGTAIDILDRIFEKRQPVTWDQYEKLREAITNIREENNG